MVNDPFGSTDTPNNPGEPAVPNGDASTPLTQPDSISPWAPRPDGASTPGDQPTTRDDGPSTPPPTMPPPGTPPTGAAVGGPGAPGDVPPPTQMPPGGPHPGMSGAGSGMALAQKPYSPVPWIILGILGILGGLFIGGGAVFLAHSGFSKAGLDSEFPTASERTFNPSEFFENIPSEDLEDFDPSEFLDFPIPDPSPGPSIEQSAHGVQGDGVHGLFYESPLGKQRKDASEVTIGKSVENVVPSKQLVAYKINLTAGKKIKISVVGKASGDFHFWILDPDKKLIAYQDDGKTDLNPTLEFIAPVDGTYELLVGESSGKEDSHFTLTINE